MNNFSTKEIVAREIIAKEIIAREIIDSRGFPTVEVEMVLEPNFLGRAAVPSGASTGKFEALELRDGDKSYFLGKGVKQAVKNIRQIIAPKLLGQKNLSQQELDQILLDLDGTENKSKLGANAVLGVSLAYARACSAAHNLPLFLHLKNQFASQFKYQVQNLYELPVPLINILNGGAHANNNLDIQEFMIVPAGFDTFKRALQAGCEVFHSLKKISNTRGYSTAVGDEGGLAPNLSSNEEALELVMEAIDRAGYTAGKDIFIALDVASSEFYQDGNYFFASQNQSSQEMVDFYTKLIKNFPIVSLEDALDQEDWDGWKMLTEKIGGSCQLVGDDLFVTNPIKLKQAIDKKVGNSILIKLNQIGSLSETMETIAIAQKANYSCIISHRSGETEDTFIADLAVATNAKQIKTGSASRSERIAKYNQLLRIEEKLGDRAMFSGMEIYSRLLN